MIKLEEYLKAYNKSPFYSEPYDGIEEDKNIIKEYNKDLCNRFPWLIPTNRWSGKKITTKEKGYWPKDPNSIPEYDYEYTELDDMPSGWRIAFGEKMCQEINDELVKFNFVDQYRITQIKEKFGGLRWYDSGYPIGDIPKDYEIVKTDKIYEYPHEDDDYYAYIGKDDDENYTCIYKHYKLINKCKIGDIIRKYEDLSFNTCINCGKPAKWLSRGWIEPLCDDCANKTIDDDKSLEDVFDKIE